MLSVEASYDERTMMNDGKKPWIEPVTLDGDIVRLDPLTREDVPKLWQIAQHESTDNRNDEFHNHTSRFQGR